MSILGNPITDEQAASFNSLLMLGHDHLVSQPLCSVMMFTRLNLLTALTKFIETSDDVFLTAIPDHLIFYSQTRR